MSNFALEPKYLSLASLPHASETAIQIALFRSLISGEWTRTSFRKRDEISKKECLSMHSGAYGTSFAPVTCCRRGDSRSPDPGRKTLLIALRCFPFCSFSVREWGRMRHIRKSRRGPWGRKGESPGAAEVWGRSLADLASGHGSWGTSHTQRSQGTLNSMQSLLLDDICCDVSWKKLLKSFQERSDAGQRGGCPRVRNLAFSPFGPFVFVPNMEMATR